jgi:hypothetical protein
VITGVGADGTVRIDAEHRGPPTSGNGGWTAGTLAGDGPAEVSLRRPIPLDTPLEIGRLKDGAVALLDDGEVVIEARDVDPAELEALAASMPVVTVDAARRAGEATPLAATHPFPTCFGCGPEHPHGLHCLAGPADDGLWAVAFTPESDDPRIAWAALDCPGSAPHAAQAPGVPHVLGRMTALVLAPLEAGAEHAVVVRPTRSAGRRRFSDTAIVDASGSVRAVARTVWVTLPS